MKISKFMVIVTLLVIVPFYFNLSNNLDLVRLLYHSSAFAALICLIGIILAVLKLRPSKLLNDKNNPIAMIVMSAIVFVLDIVMWNQGRYEFWKSLLKETGFSNDVSIFTLAFTSQSCYVALPILIIALFGLVNAAVYTLKLLKTKSN